MKLGALVAHVHYSNYNNENNVSTLKNYYCASLNPATKSLISRCLASNELFAHVEDTSAVTVNFV